MDSYYYYFYYLYIVWLFGLPKYQYKRIISDLQQLEGLIRKTRVISQEYDIRFSFLPFVDNVCFC